MTNEELQQRVLKDRTKKLVLASVAEWLEESKDLHSGRLILERSNDSDAVTIKVETTILSKKLEHQ